MDRSAATLRRSIPLVGSVDDDQFIGEQQRG
jgi:hypothetical protein